MKMTNIEENSTKGYKVRLYPNKKQRKLLFEYFNMAKFVYNKCIDIQEEQKDSKIPYQEMVKIFTKLKHEDDKYKWLDSYSADSIRGAIMDCDNAYKNHFKNPKYFNKPSYKNKNSKKQFYTTPSRMNITEDYVKLSSIGNIKYCNSYCDEILGTGYKYRKDNSMKYIHYYNARISYDGLNFYLSFIIPRDQEHTVNSYDKFAGNTEWQEQESSESIGIDVGLRNEKWMVDSTGRTVERPDSDKLRKRISRYERKYQRQKDTNLKKNPNFFKYHPNGSKNMQKTMSRINKDYKKIANRRRNVVHEYACDLIKLKPKSIVMESTFSKNMIDNNSRSRGKRKLNQMTYDAALYESTMIIEEKAISNGIKVIRADSGFPSSQICSCCGYRQNIGRANYYRCPVCGTVINRDLNAAINLANYMHIKDKYIQEEIK